MRYCFSTDEENFQGDFATREEAAEAGRAYVAGDGDHEWFNIWTAESHRCATEEFLPRGDDMAEHAIEHMTEQAREVWEEAEFPDVSREDVKYLGEKLAAALKAWVDEKCPAPTVFRCENVKCHTFPSVPS